MHDRNVPVAEVGLDGTVLPSSQRVALLHADLHSLEYFGIDLAVAKMCGLGLLIQSGAMMDLRFVEST